MSDNLNLAVQALSNYDGKFSKQKKVKPTAKLTSLFAYQILLYGLEGSMMIHCSNLR